MSVTFARVYESNIVHLKFAAGIVRPANTDVFRLFAQDTRMSPITPRESPCRPGRAQPLSKYFEHAIENGYEKHKRDYITLQMSLAVLQYSIVYKVFLRNSSLGSAFSVARPKSQVQPTDGTAFHCIALQHSRSHTTFILQNSTGHCR